MLHGRLDAVSGLGRDGDTLVAALAVVLGELEELAKVFGVHGAVEVGLVGDDKEELAGELGVTELLVEDLLGLLEALLVGRVDNPDDAVWGEKGRRGCERRNERL